MKGTVSQEESARDRVRRQRRARKRRKTLRVVLVFALVLGVVGGGYAAGYTYFCNHYYPGTTVSGIDASGMTKDELEQRLVLAVESYAVTASRGSLTIEVAGSDIDLAANKDVAQSLMDDQDVRAWPLGALGSGDKSERGIDYDAKKLDALVTKAVKKYNKTATQPQSASLTLNEATHQFALEAQKPGTALSAKESCKIVRGAVDVLQHSVELGDEALKQPKVTKDSPEAKAALKQANDAFSLQIPLVRGEEELTTIASETLGAWIVANGLVADINKEAASDYVANDLWRYTDYSDDQNAYVVDADALANKISEFVKAGGGDPVEVTYAATPLYLPGAGALNPAEWEADRGRYIDINKTEQVACLYDATGKVLWETPVTTGNEKDGHGTPVGEYDVYDKQTDFMLLGEDKNNDGKPDYERHVDYWMPFFSGIGMHDADWRTVYGGQEHLENGSGGCVNLPKDAAAALFAIAHVGDAVVVHD